jgi:hypothetical protein
MLSSYPVACPHDDCDWTGSLIPSLVRGGPRAEITSLQQAWFRCPRCRRDWEARIKDDTVIILLGVEQGIKGASATPA